MQQEESIKGKAPNDDSVVSRFDSLLRRTGGDDPISQKIHVCMFCYFANKKNLNKGTSIRNLQTLIGYRPEWLDYVDIGEFCRVEG